MELPRGCRAKHQDKIRHFNDGRIGVNSHTLLVIKLPDSRVLRVLSRSVFLAMVILTLPCIWSIFSGPSYFSSSEYSPGSDSMSFESLDRVINDMGSEGLIRKGDKALILSSGIEAVIDIAWFLNDNGFELVMESDLERKSSVPDEAFDFVFSLGSLDDEFVDRIVRTGGILAVLLNGDLSRAYQKPSNYKTVYLRRYNSTIMAMRKTSPNSGLVDSSTKRRLCQLAMESKKAALKGLEDVFLEPPRRALARTNKYLKEIKFLPDLLGDSLESYSRRVFINVGFSKENKGMTKWFRENYPMRNQKFEVHHVEMAPQDELKMVAPRVDVSDWLVRNVREEEYVVMKAEAEVVEDMIKRKTICLVDELFLECKNQWQGWGKKKSKRAYWECLALYGRLRDEGVAVHQWWG